MPPAVHPLLVGLVNPRAPSRPRYNEELKQALRNVTSVLRYEEVPERSGSCCTPLTRSTTGAACTWRASCGATASTRPRST
jgi:hypothetical protein